MIRTLHIIRLLSRNTLWRIIPLIIVLFMIGTMGTYSICLSYDLFMQIKSFDNAQTQDFLWIMQINKQPHETAEWLNRNKSVKQIEYKLGHYAYITGRTNSSSKMLSCSFFSKDYLKSLNWPVNSRIDSKQRLSGTIAIWADPRMKDKYQAGDTIDAKIKDEEGNKTHITMQIVAFLNKDGSYPDTPIFYDYASPTIHGLSQTIDFTNEPWIVVADYDDFADQLKEKESTFIPNARPIAVRLTQDADKTQIMDLQREMFSNSYGAAYTLDQIKSNTIKEWRSAMRRNQNNAYIVLYVAICAISVIQISLIHRKKLDIGILRLLGTSRKTLRNAWLTLFVPLVGISTFCGACFTEIFSGWTSAFARLQNTSWLRLIPSAIMISVSIIISLIYFAIKNKTEVEEI